ncbi:TetR/AcrR family transcriptional regulator [Phreatobacter sp.]|uniref:TetR/AcrR family transcriptional regulator n=1 Tax=Phreatobacter sp. TaxID=1966341 RepID=UPI0022CB4236|nr:TetR/AcrR family transcriptional regulator [Phreatobacter sp.]MCZ8314029.1 helix-turn-helix domain containing protein [Phreatobacter sp.]
MPTIYAIAPMEGAALRGAILDAADQVFVRHGFRGAAMEDIARVAGVSPDSLYSQFSSKEAIFAAAVERTLDAFRERVAGLLRRHGVAVETRVLDAFCTAHTTTIGSAIMGDIIAACEALVAPLIRAFERDLAAEVAETLAIAGIPARWSAEGLSADDLAGHLIILSVGITHKAADPVDYRARMASAIRLVCRTPKLVR